MFQKTFTAAVRSFKTITNGFLKLINTSVSLIVSLMAKDFITFVIGSFLIALPVAWWFMNNGIPDFLYLASKIGWLFIITFAVLLLIALLILSIRTIRSAFENPVRSLRTM